VTQNCTNQKSTASVEKLWLIVISLWRLENVFHSPFLLFPAHLRSTFYRTGSTNKISVYITTCKKHLTGITLFKGGQFDEIINTALGVKKEVSKNRQNRLKISFMDIQQSKHLMGSKVNKLYRLCCWSKLYTEKRTSVKKVWIVVNFLLVIKVGHI